MSKSFILPASLLVLCCTAQALGSGVVQSAAAGSPQAGAETGSSEVPVRRHRYNEANHRRFIEEHDADGDGRVTLVEFIEFRQRRFNDGDVNGDGCMDEQEYVDEYVPRMDAQLERERAGAIEQTYRRFEALDRNGDGVIDREEFQASGERIFSHLDPDNTGRIVQPSEADDAENVRRRSPRLLSMPTTHTLSGFMELYDVDASGVVTRAQFERLRQAQFEAIDAGGDGVVNQEEYVVEFETRLDRQLERTREDQISRAHTRFNVVDLNGDGCIDLNEYLRVGLRTFERWDITGTGVASADDPLPEPEA